MIYTWTVERLSKEDREKFEIELQTPLPGQIESAEDAEDEMAQMKNLM